MEDSSSAIKSQTPFEHGKEDHHGSISAASQHTTSTNSHSAGLVRTDTGPQAWLAVLAGFLLLIIAWGPTVAYGLFQDYYQTVLLPTYSASTISWIGTVGATLLIITGVVAGPLFDQGYMQYLMALGCFLSVFGTMMLSLSTQYYQIMLSQGFCVGIGGGLVYVPALAMVNTRFAARSRAIAMGIVTSGVSIAGVLYPIIFLHLLPRVGFPWTVRIIGFVSLFCVLIALPLLLAGPSPEKKPARQIIHWHAFKEAPFNVYGAFGVLVFMAYLIPLVYIPSYSNRVLGTSTDTGYYQLAVSNAGSVIGRLGPPFISQMVGAHALMMGGVIATTAICFGWIGVTSSAGFWVWCACFGAFSGVLISANPIVAAHPVIAPVPSVMGTRLGMQWFLTGLGVLVGSPIAGALLGSSESSRTGFLYLQVFSGSILAGSALFFAWLCYYVWKHNQQQQKR